MALSKADLGAVVAALTAHAAAPASQKTVVALHRRVVRLTIHNFAFQPARLIVSPGTRLIWTNTDSDPHTVPADRPPVADPNPQQFRPGRPHGDGGDDPLRPPPARRVPSRFRNRARPQSSQGPRAS